MTTVVITGANRGIGLELTRQMLARGWRVFAGCRNPSSNKEPFALNHQDSERLSLFEIDVTDERSVTEAAADIARKASSFDILINNAGVYPEGGDESFEDVPLELFQAAMEVNYLGPIRVTRALLPLLRKSSRGRILNLSSGAATITTKSDSRRYCYGPSKTALNMFTRTLAYELIKDGIVATAMSPGWVRTEMGGPDAELSPGESVSAMIETLDGLSPDEAGLFLDRFGNADHYAW
jgi:NAD(P)-dependent dehydrogenase (short-subunit alcohol dehydrogenase family)